MKKNLFSLLLLAGCITTAVSLNVRASAETKVPTHRVDMPTSDEAKRLRVGVIKSTWNPTFTTPMFNDCLEELIDAGVKDHHIVVAEVPGALELSLAAQKMIAAGFCDVCICLGAIIEGPHVLWPQALAHAVVQNLSSLSMATGVPVICGVLICTDDDAHILVRHGIGGDWARSALQMSLAVDF